MKKINSSSLQYDFILDGGRSNQLITLVNSTNKPLSLKRIQIMTNATIQSPWQVLGAYWQNVKIEKNNSFYTYTLDLPEAISIPPGTTKVLEYSVQSTGNLGPIQVAMSPQQIAVQLAGESAWQTINLTNSNPMPDPHPNTEFNMYHANWGQYVLNNQTIETEAWNDINALSYAFVGFDKNGNVFSLDSWADQLELPSLALQKQRRPYLKSSISFGGWTNGGQRMDTVFSAMAANPTARANFVNNAVLAVNETGLDGIDIDWEYPKSADVPNFILLLQALRAALPYPKRITITAPAAVANISLFTPQQWQQIAGLVDRISIMCYDYYGGFSDVADFHSPWKLSPNSPHYKNGDDTELTLDTFHQMGVPANKIALGIPNYSRGVIVNKEGEYAGLYQPVVGTPQGDAQGDDGVYCWDSIQKCLNNEPSKLDALGVKKWNYYDSTHPLCQDAKMCLLSGELPDGRWVVINFLDPTCAKWRAQQAMQSKFGGAMIWANYEESTNPKNKIVDAVSEGLSLSNRECLTVNNATTKNTIANQKNVLLDHAGYLQHAFFAKSKEKILNEMACMTNVNEMQKMLDDNKEKLGRHRNIFKRFVSALSQSMANSLFAKPKSLQLAEQLLALKVPTKTITPPAISEVETTRPVVLGDQPPPGYIRDIYKNIYNPGPVVPAGYELPPVFMRRR